MGPGVNQWTRFISKYSQFHFLTSVCPVVISSVFPFPGSANRAPHRAFIFLFSHHAFRRVSSVSRSLWQTIDSANTGMSSWSVSTRICLFFSSRMSHHIRRQSGSQCRPPSRPWSGRRPWSGLSNERYSPSLRT